MKPQSTTPLEPKSGSPAITALPNQSSNENSDTMKPNRFTKSLFFLAACAVTILGGTVARASNYYWDTNSTTAGFGTAGGTWGTDTDWSTDGTGVATPTVLSPATTDSLNFGNGATGLAAGTITVGTVNAGDMTFASGSGATVLSGGTITLAAAETTTVNNATDTIGSVEPCHELAQMYASMSGRKRTRAWL